MTAPDTGTQVRHLLRTTPGALSLLEASMTWMDKLYDSKQGLLRHPTHPARHMVRESLWYAFGLVLQEQTGHPVRRRGRLEKIVSRVLDSQYNAPDQLWHGTFKRSPQEPDPPPEARIWQDYDPNWRQFVGTLLLLLRRLEGEQRLGGLLPRIDAALQRCIEGEPGNRVPPGYTNIALMKAWLEVECGTLASDAVHAGGLRYASAIQAVFAEHGAFPEYNSPTYYGINFFALGLWTNFSAALAVPGTEITARLWSDVARFYHAGMKNLCGPWSRSYGVDMQDYVAALGLWIWAATDRASAPFPRDLDSLQHGHDFCLGPLAAVTAAGIPDSARQHLVDFHGARQIRQQISTVPSRWANALIGERLMLGLETSPQSFHGTEQYHPLTVHWLDTGNRVCWGRLRFAGSILGDLEGEQLRLRLKPDEGTQVAVIEFSHEVMLSGQVARCSGLAMTLVTDGTISARGNRLQILLADNPAESAVAITCEVSP